MKNRLARHPHYLIQGLTIIRQMSLFLVVGFIGLIPAPQIALSQEGETGTPSSRASDRTPTQHGFYDFETVPAPPSEAAPNPLPYYQDLEALPGSDQKPTGLFLDITLAEGFEEDLEFRRGNYYHAVQPTDEFSSSASAVYVVFRVFKHYQAYQVIGQMFPDEVEGTPTDVMLDEDMAYLALEDESGYLKFFPPHPDGWMPGDYRIDIFVGYEANAISKMGTLRFRVSTPS